LGPEPQLQAGLRPRDDPRGRAVELFIAGSDTTAMTILWALFLLDQHPDVLDAVQAEVHTVLGSRDPSPAALRSLALRGATATQL
jgi:cytochrome P450